MNKVNTNNGSAIISDNRLEQAAKGGEVMNSRASPVFVAVLEILSVPLSRQTTSSVSALSPQWHASGFTAVVPQKWIL